MREEGKSVSIAQLCRWFGVPRSIVYYRPSADAVPKPPVVDRALETKIREIIDQEPAAGLRMITARIRRGADAPVNKPRPRLPRGCCGQSSSSSPQRRG
jgi:hypothetical protein